jgi:proline iminopeptidase
LSGGPGYSGDYLTDVFTHVAQHARAVLLDQRGTGQSRLKRLDSTTITLQKEIEDVDALRVALHVDRITLLGHSWGGQLAMAYAAAHPDHVAALILVGSGGPSLRSQDTIGKKLAARLTPADRDSISAWSALATGPRRAEALREMARLDRKAYMYDVRKQPAVEREKGGASFDSRVSTLVFQDLERTHFDLSASLARLREQSSLPFPVLLIYGDADVIGVTTAPEISPLFPQAQKEIVPHSGHYPWIEAPSRFYSDLDRFTSRPPPRPTAARPRPASRPSPR